MEFCNPHIQWRRHTRACLGKCPGKNTSALAAALEVKCGNNNIICQDSLTARAHATNDLSMPCQKQRPGLCLFACVSVCVFICILSLCVCLSVCASLSVWLPVSVSVCSRGGQPLWAGRSIKIKIVWRAVCYFVFIRPTFLRVKDEGPSVVALASPSCGNATLSESLMTFSTNSSPVIKVLHLLSTSHQLISFAPQFVFI